MKYFLLGAFASAFFVYGAALIYGATGSTQYNAISEMVGSGEADPTLLYPGIALLIVGFGFKVSLVPFHMWTPDVYQGSPTPVTAFMSAGTKAAAFAAMIRVLVVALPAQQANWGWMLALLAVLTMTLGNLAALRQTSLKRMLAYSSIAHAGYILVGLTPGTDGRRQCGALLPLQLCLHEHGRTGRGHCAGEHRRERRHAELRHRSLQAAANARLCDCRSSCLG